MSGIHLSPAETLMLTKPLVCDPLDLLSYTLAELVFMNVITLRPEKVQANPNSPGMIKQVSIYNGPNFDRFEPDPHHFIFLDPIAATKRIGLHTLAQKILKRYTDSALKDFKQQEVFNSVSRAKRLFSSEKYSSLIMLQRSSLGKQVNRGISRHLKSVKSNYKNWVSQESPELLQALLALGPNLLLVKGLDFGELVHLESVNPANSQTDGGGTPPAVYYAWGGMEQHLNFKAMKDLDAYVVRFEKIFLKYIAPKENTTQTKRRYERPGGRGYR